MSANSGSLASEEVSIRFCGKHNPEVNQDPRNLKTGQQKPQLKMFSTFLDCISFTLLLQTILVKLPVKPRP